MMKISIIMTILCLIVISLLDGQDSYPVYIDPDLITIGVGEYVVLNIIITIPVSGFEFILNHDESLLSLESVTRGNDWPEPFFWSNSHFIAGAAAIGTGPIELSGTVAQAQFRAIGEGDAIIELTNLFICDTLGNDNTPTNIDGSVITIQNTLLLKAPGMPIQIRN